MPFGTTLAASLGARVIKLEDRNGDPMRSAFGPPEFTACKTMEGKESLALDLRTAEGCRIVHQLIEKADAFVHGFRPGVTERLGIDYPTLSAINPRLVYFHAPSYGVDGPYAHRPTYASEAAAVGGVYHRQAGFWLDPSIAEGMSAAELQAIFGARLRAGLTPGDAFAALAVFSGLSCALLHQRRTGEGQFLSRSMIGANCFGFSDDFNAYAGKPSIPIPDSENFGTGALYRLYETADGWVFLAVTTEREWEAFVAAVGGALADDARFMTAAARRAADGDLAVAIAEVFASGTADDWEAKLAPAGVACVHAFETTQPRAAASMSGVSEFTLTDPVIRELGLVTEVDHPVLGRIARHGLPIEFSETPGRIAPGCRTGQHTEAILTELGYTPEGIAKLHADDIVSIPR
jgi:crotonobetainyl-CoA:carnitine CoA-transferase CaiB-like acyl-CoA transferase